MDDLFPNGFPGFDLEHAALIETSMMAKLRPDLVQHEKIAKDNVDKLPHYGFSRNQKVLPLNLVCFLIQQKQQAEKGEMIIEKLCRRVKMEFNI